MRFKYVPNARSNSCSEKALDRIGALPSCTDFVWGAKIALPKSISGVSMKVNDAIQAFLHEHVSFRDLSSASARAYTQRLKGFSLFLEQRGITDVEVALTESVVADYFQYLARTHSKESTIYAKKQVLVMFWEWANDKGLAKPKPAIRLKKPPEPQTTCLTKEESARLELAARGGTTPLGTLHLRDSACFRVLYELGIGIQDVVRLSVRDYDPKESLLRIRGLLVKISPDLKSHLDRYLFIRRAAGIRSDYLFPSRSGKCWGVAGVRKAIQRHRKTAQLPPLVNGRPFHPRKWPIQEQHAFINTPVIPYDRSPETAQLIIELGLHCGLRRGEMLSLKVQNVDLDRRKLYVRGKGNKQRKVCLNQHMVEILRPIVSTRSPSQPLLLNHQGAPISSPRQINDIVHALAVRAGIVGKKVTPHTLRHTYATLMAERTGFNLPVVQESLGHSSPSETMRYIHLDEHRIQESVEELGNLYARAEEQIINEWMNGDLCSQ